ncbi:MAG: hypothetical protein L0Y57_04210 [Beijerinckiaceae bacterium]|nr:hypothetical protein [Beijerinckiaceae bacterium]
MFEGEDLASLSARRLRARRKDIQIIFQDPYASLNPRMRVMEIVEEGMAALAIGASESERQRRVDGLLEQVGLAPDMKLRYPHEFSGYRHVSEDATRAVFEQMWRVTLDPEPGLRIPNMLDEAGAAAHFEKVRIPKEEIKTSEDAVLNSVGADLCEKFFRGYTRKQWGLDLSELAAGVAARIPTRTNDDDRYFSDSFQFMPAQGYAKMFARMLDHPNIEIALATDFFAVRASHAAREIIYTGPIDAYFDYRFGKLPYRSLRFEHEHLPDAGRFQPVGTVNYPNDHSYTRITEFKHLTGQLHRGTSLVREYPQSGGDPYYPIPRPDNEALFKQYAALAAAEPNVHFAGRLAEYRYYNMDQVVAAALALAEKKLGVPPLEQST